ncbi:Fc.00g106170.m01.CDS01 [Cosmosporella sp. VM-42]
MLFSLSLGFFDTVGAVMPYISETELLKEADTFNAQPRLYHAIMRRDMKALGSIVIAYALATLDGSSPSPFYVQALELLDERVRGPAGYCAPAV